MMAPERPQVPEGLGQKSQFQELRLGLKTHKTAEFETDDNIIKIILDCPNQLKTTYKLTQYKKGEEKEMPECILTEVREDDIVFRFAVPEPAYYKFNIFAMPIEGTGSLPNVFTYLIHVKTAKMKVCPYPKQFADWRRGCLIQTPRYLDTSKPLTDVAFKVKVPGAKRVAVKAQDEWTQLERKGDCEWEGYVNLEYYRNKGVTVDLNACMGSDETAFVTMLRYNI